jgi:hypothetical protein
LNYTTYSAHCNNFFKKDQLPKKGWLQGIKIAIGVGVFADNQAVNFKALS